jgi:hypothetical protein
LTGRCLRPKSQTPLRPASVRPGSAEGSSERFFPSPKNREKPPNAIHKFARRVGEPRRRPSVFRAFGRSLEPGYQRRQPSKIHQVSLIDVFAFVRLVARSTKALALSDRTWKACGQSGGCGPTERGFCWRAKATPRVFPDRPKLGTKTKLDETKDETQIDTFLWFF